MRLDDKHLQQFDKDPVRDRKDSDRRVGRLVQGPEGEGDEFPDFSTDTGAAARRARRPGQPPPIPPDAR